MFTWYIFSVFIHVLQDIHTRWIMFTLLQHNEVCLVTIIIIALTLVKGIVDISPFSAALKYNIILSNIEHSQTVQ